MCVSVLHTHIAVLQNNILLIIIISIPTFVYFAGDLKNICLISNVYLAECNSCYVKNILIYECKINVRVDILILLIH